MNGIDDEAIQIVYDNLETILVTFMTLMVVCSNQTTIGNRMQSKDEITYYVVHSTYEFLEHLN